MRRAVALLGASVLFAVGIAGCPGARPDEATPGPGAVGVTGVTSPSSPELDAPPAARAPDVEPDGAPVAAAAPTPRREAESMKAWATSAVSGGGGAAGDQTSAERFTRPVPPDAPPEAFLRIAPPGDGR